MPSRPEIFVSTTSADLRSCRDLICKALLTLDCMPVVQEHFPPDARSVREMLRGKISQCNSVVHVAGERYGAEPREREANEPRRSYTQLEYELARELGKPCYVFVCAEGFPYDANEPEPDELRSLQQQHRERLIGGDGIYRTVSDKHDLDLRVHELQVALDHERKRADEAEAEVARLRKLLEGLISEKILQRVPGGGAASGQADALLFAQADVARERGVGIDELKAQLASEGADVRAIIGTIEKRSAEVQAQAAEFARLQREAYAKLGDTEFAAGRFLQSIEPYRKALALADGKVEPLCWCGAADKLLDALYEQGLFSEGVALAQQVVEKRVAIQAPEHREALSSVTRLADFLRATGDLKAAEEHGRRALAAMERTLGVEHRDTLSCRVTLAGVLAGAGKLAEAEEMYRRAMEAQERTLGVDDWDTLRCVNNLGVLLHDRGDVTGSEALYRRGFDADKRFLGPEHPQTLCAEHNIAAILYAKDDLAGAEEIWRRTLGVRERTIGADHPDTLKNVMNLALLLRDKGDLNGAETFARRALDAQERTLGMEHPETLSSVNTLAKVLKAQGNLAGAESLYRRALEARERLLGPEHHETLVSIHNLALLLEAKDEKYEAGSLYRRTLEAQERTLGPDHPDTLTTLSNFGMLLARRGDRDEAESLLTRVAESRDRTVGRAHPDTCRAYHRLSLVHYQHCILLGVLNRPGVRVHYAKAHSYALRAAGGAFQCLPEGDPARVAYEEHLAIFES